MKIVLDTNVLIDGLTDEFNVQSKIVEAVIDGEIEAVYTHKIRREYELIWERFKRREADETRLKLFLKAALQVLPGEVPIRADDREDEKFIAAATGGGADLIVTSDKHLLELGEVGKIRVVTPAECWHRFEDEERGTSGVWHEWLKTFRR